MTSRTLTVTDYLQPGDPDWTLAFQRCIDALAAGYQMNRQGGTVYVPDGDYLLSATLVIQTGGITISGQSSSGTRLVRRSDYGQTIKFDGPALANNPATLPLPAQADQSDYNFLVNGGLNRLQFWDQNQSMVTTTDNKGFHVYVDYAVELHFHDLIFTEGAGAVALMGAADFRGEMWKFKTTAGVATDRIGILIGATTLNSVALKDRHGGDIMLSDINIQGSLAAVNDTTKLLSPSDCHLDYGIQVDAVDGLWLSQVHCIATAKADMRMTLHKDQQLTNVIATDLFLDIATGDGLVLDKTTDTPPGQSIQQCSLRMNASCSAAGQSGKAGIRKSVLTNGVRIDADVSGWRGIPVSWKGGAIDDSLDLLVTAANNADSVFAIEIEDPLRTIVRPKSVGATRNGVAKLVGGIHLLADTGNVFSGTPRSLSITGGRIGELPDGAPALKIDSGFGADGASTVLMTGVDCVKTAGILNAAPYVTVEAVGCAGIVTWSAPGQRSIQSSGGFSDRKVYRVALPAAYKACVVELTVAGLIGGAGTTTTTQRFAVTTDAGAATATPIENPIATPVRPNNTYFSFGTVVSPADPLAIDFSLYGGPANASASDAAIKLSLAGNATVAQL